jgi:ATP-binding cassette, subfamily B, multidrug efflux pump
VKPASLLWRFVKTHKGTYVLSLVTIIIAEIVTVQFPHILGKFTNALQKHHLTMAGVRNYALLLLGVGVVYVIFYAIGQMQNGRQGRLFEYELRERLFAHWETLSTSYFRRRSVGDLLNHAMNDVQQVREAMSGGLNILTNSIFLLISTLIMTLLINVWLTCVSLIPLLFIPIFIVWWGPRIRHASRQVQEGLSAMSELTEESITAIRLIKATGNEEIEAKRFSLRVENIVLRQMSMFQQSALFQSLIPLMGSLSFGIALLYGGDLLIRGKIELGSFVAFTLYVTLLIQPLQQIGFVINNFQRASASLARLNVLFTEQPDIYDTSQALELNQLAGDIQVDLPAFTYPDGSEPALRNIQFRVFQGQTLGIVGRTGSGKTTLVNLLPRIFDPPEATVFVDGHDIRSLRLASLREGIAYVPQDGFLFSTSIGENIGFSAEHVTMETLVQAAKAASVFQEIEEMPQQFDTVIGERGVTLSGGQRQRTALARAFVKNAPILILDDSLSAVDMNTEKSILSALQTMRVNKTTVVIAHRLSAVRHADWILVMEDGQISEQGTHEQLLAYQGVYTEIYHLQQEGEAETG